MWNFNEDYEDRKVYLICTDYGKVFTAFHKWDNWFSYPDGGKIGWKVKCWMEIPS